VNGYHYAEFLTGLSGVQLPLARTDDAENIHWVYGLVLDEVFGFIAEEAVPRLSIRALALARSCGRCTNRRHLMTTESLKEAIKRELPEFLRSDPDFRAYILELTRQEYAGRAETQDRFYEILAELRKDREGNQAELRKDREEQARKWDENQAELKRLHEEIMAQAQKHDRSIGALGSRWGLQSEKAFRDALAGILEKNFGVEVLNVNEYDEQGVVFGRPDQVELDVIIKNGLLLICELKSSIDKAGMYIFERKARFYEQRHQRTADRLIVISPMIDARARKVADKLGIETYGDSTEVEG
jgi:hypothetical protein